MWRLAIAGIVEHARQPVEQGLASAEASRASALASDCSITCGGTAVASESRLQGRMISPNLVRHSRRGSPTYLIRNRSNDATLHASCTFAGTRRVRLIADPRSADQPSANGRSLSTEVTTFDSPWAMDFLPGLRRAA